MKNKHLKLVSCALMASLFSTSSCVDNDYDLMEDIDLTIQVGGSEFAIPGGETEPIKLSKILDIEEDGVVKIDENGNYFLLQEGTEQTTNISVDGFEIESPAINPIRQTLNFTVPSYNSIGIKANGIELPPVDLPTERTSFNLSSSDLPKEIKGLSFINVDMIAAIHFSFEPSIVDNLYLKTINLNFPKFIKSQKLAEGVLHLEEKTASSTNGLTVYIPIDGIDCSSEQQGITFEEGNLSIQGEISLDGAVTINTGEIHGQPGSVTVTLKADITLLDAQTQREIINVQSIIGKVKPDIDINIEPVTLTGLPDFLDDERVTLSVERPMIFFTANNNTPVSAQITTGEIRSFTNKNGIKEPVSENPATFDFTIDKESNEKFCLYPADFDESEIKKITKDEGVTQHIKVEHLTALISKIPDIFEFDVVAEAIEDDNTEVMLNHTYTITTDYDVNVPFVFGDQISQIVYKDSVDGWYDDLKDYEVQQVNATATAINKIPLGLNFTAKALTIDANGNTEELKGVTVTVIVDGKQNGIIKAGISNTAVESALVIEIKEITSGAVKKLDGLAFEIVAATSGNEAKGQQLNENQTLQLKNVRLKVPGGAIVDLN